MQIKHYESSDHSCEPEWGMKIRDLPSNERPYEKFEQYGASALSDAELLAVILRTGSRNSNSVELARKVLMLSKNQNNLLGLYHVSFHELLTLKGVGRVKAIQILCIAELSKRMAKATYENGISFQNPQSIANYFMEELRHLSKEHIKILLFDSRHRLLKELTISKGTVNSAITTPREVYIEALRYEAVYVIVLHNHPSGDPTPSKADLILTRRLQEAGALIGIELSDHIIIGNQCYISLREKGMMTV